MRQLIPTILCPNDFVAYHGYRQFRNRLLLVESLCECHLGPVKSRCGKLRCQWKPQHGVYEARNSIISRELGCSGLYIESHYRVFYHVPADSFFRAGNILFR